MRTSRMSLFTHHPAICTCNNAEQSSIRSITARHSLHHFLFDGLDSSSYQPASPLTSCRVQNTPRFIHFLLHRVAGVACEWLPPFLDLSHARRDTVKRVKLADARSCSPRISRGTLPTLLPSSQIAVKVAVVLVAFPSQLTLRRSCCFFSAHMARLIKCGDLSLSSILDAVAKSTLQSQKIASSTNVQVNSNDACSELMSCS